VLKLPGSVSEAFYEFVNFDCLFLPLSCAGILICGTARALGDWVYDALSLFATDASFIPLKISIWPITGMTSANGFSCPRNVTSNDEETRPPPRLVCTYFVVLQLYCPFLFYLIFTFLMSKTGSWGEWTFDFLTIGFGPIPFALNSFYLPFDFIVEIS